ncbi:MAG: class I SAM-dependent methyltransferase [Moorea sp. SIO1G6]|uniref:class I SAM-dependent methyltransferase n=1 Tax=unclassified Moorena TaxID=2683338 RepID=UPI0013BB7627|nr:MULTISPECIES: class I SAM-dependent methyltransferase [unclassified Moorena]NEQ07200.1 class I SAM-dependent methyltransferase [Moorena sp. SIO4E2]NEQ12543.1 class I SAM-dependent methyltransferase [Moorena sp. SIO3E2]NES81199.1 class I SAM-dependent methyltransferase [Moorena sp. SIO2B7]NET69203.1 class I SAM-dependent methyltransferase [Moorena sp. SIO1G6]
MIFDDQAKTFEARTGLSELTCQAVAETAFQLAEIQARDCIVEVGAGTGQIGQWFTSESVQYLGFDLSEPMLQEFRQHLDHPRDNFKIVQGDANQYWPVKDGTANLIFSSRTLHLLNLEHIVSESWRIAHAERAVVLMGTVQRQKNSVKNQMRDQMQTLLAKETLQGRQKNKLMHQLIERFTQDGAQTIEPMVVSSWKVVSTPRQSLDSWRGKANLAGIELGDEIKHNVLDQLEVWAQATFGGLDQPIESEETYILQGVRLN